MAPAAPYPARKFIGNACGLVSLLPLILLAEWVPQLLPRSPNLAHYASSAFVRSVLFPILMLLLGVTGIVTCILLRRAHRFGRLAFGLFWGGIVCSIAYPAVRASLELKVRGLALLIALAYLGAQWWRRLGKESQV
jgi:hypothetical protein